MEAEVPAGSTVNVFPTEMTMNHISVKVQRWWRLGERPDHLLSQFHCADEERLRAAGELEMLGAQMDDGHCHQMIHQLRSCKVRVLDILNQMMDVCIPGERACRDFWIQFPEEGRHVSLEGSLWFRAESLAACSDQEAEREVMRHLAQDLVSCLDEVCQLAHEQALRDATVYPEILRNGLRRLDRLMAKFEFSYVLAMLPERCSRYQDIHQDLVLLFSQTASRALDQGYINQAMIKDCDPALMVTVPRLAIVCGLLLLPDGALQLDGAAEDVYELFKPFHSLLKTIRDHLQTLTEEELQALERRLCDPQEKELLAFRHRSSAKCLMMTSRLETCLPPTPACTPRSSFPQFAAHMDRSFPVVKSDSSASSLQPGSGFPWARPTFTAHRIHRIQQDCSAPDQMETSFPSVSQISQNCLGQVSAADGWSHSNDPEVRSFSDPDPVCDCDGFRLVKLVATDIKQQSRVLRKLAEEMEIFLWPRPNSSPHPAGRADVITHSFTPTEHTNLKHPNPDQDNSRTPRCPFSPGACWDQPGATEGLGENVSLPSSPLSFSCRSAARYSSSLPCSPLLGRGPSPSSSSDVRLSRQCVEAALERSKNFRCGSTPSTPDLCPRGKRMTFDPLGASDPPRAYANRKEVQSGGEECSEKPKGKHGGKVADKEQGKRMMHEENAGEEDSREEKQRKDDEGGRCEEDGVNRENGDNDNVEEDGKETKEVTVKTAMGIRLRDAFKPTSSHDRKMEREKGEERKREEESEESLEIFSVESQGPKHCQLSPCVCYRCPSAPPFEPAFEPATSQGLIQNKGFLSGPGLTGLMNSGAMNQSQGVVLRDLPGPGGSPSLSSRYLEVQREGQGCGTGLPRDGPPITRIYPSLSLLKISEEDKTQAKLSAEQEKSKVRRDTRDDSVMPSDLRSPFPWSL